MEGLNPQQLKAYNNNSKKHPKKQIEQVANSIKEFGFKQPIVIDKDNVVVVGHGRLEAAKLLGLKEVAGDIRDNVIPVLHDTLNAIKKDVTKKTEFFKHTA